MNKFEKLDIIFREGFTEYQAETIYYEMGVAMMDNEDEIISASMEWFENEKLNEMSNC